MDITYIRYYPQAYGCRHRQTSIFLQLRFAAKVSVLIALQYCWSGGLTENMGVITPGSALL